MSSSNRLPPLDVALALVCNSLELQRDIQGSEWCAVFGIGGIRKKMGHLPATRPAVWKTRADMVRDQGRATLAGLCDECSDRACPMKKWAFLIAAPSLPVGRRNTSR